MINKLKHVELQNNVSRPEAYGATKQEIGIWYGSDDFRYLCDLIDGFKTLSVTGFEAPTYSISSSEKSITDGATFKSRRYASRKLTVTFSITGKTRAELYDKLDVLNRICSEIHYTEIGEQLWTTRDRRGMHYIGTIDGQPSVTIAEGASYGDAVAGGSFNIRLSYPFGVSNQTFSVETDPEDLHWMYNIELDEDGMDCSYPSFPDLTLTFGDKEGEHICNNVSILFMSGESPEAEETFETHGVLFFGNGDRKPSTKKIIFNTEFGRGDPFGTGWQINAIDHPYGDYYKNLNIGSNVEIDRIFSSDLTKPVKPSSYGTHHVEDGCHGPLISRNIPLSEDVTSFDFTWMTRLCMTNGKVNEVGVFHVFILGGEGDSEDEILAGIMLNKTGPKASARLSYIHDNILTKNIATYDLTFYNKYFGVQGKPNKNHVHFYYSIRRVNSGDHKANKLLFNIGGYEFERTCNNKFGEKTAKRVVFYWGQYEHNKKSQAHIKYAGVYNAKFIKTHNEGEDYSFDAGDELKIDTSSGKATVNNLNAMARGSLDNDWDNAYFTPRKCNRITLEVPTNTHKDMYPYCKIKYKKVYL